MASDRAEQLADAVKSIAKTDTEDVPLCRCDLCGHVATLRLILAAEADGGYDHRDITESEPLGCVGAMIDDAGYVTLPKQHTPAENLATLEAWIESRFEDSWTHFIHRTGGACAVSWHRTDGARIAHVVEHTEAEARSKSAIQAVAAILKEGDDGDL